MIKSSFVSKVSQDMTGYGIIYEELWINNITFDSNHLPIDNWENYGSDLTSERFNEDELAEFKRILIHLRDFIGEPAALLVEKKLLLEKFKSIDYESDPESDSD
jgi:putative NIF3 family GTP cyclohydrolase 1 type 2